MEFPRVCLPISSALSLAPGVEEREAGASGNDGPWKWNRIELRYTLKRKISVFSAQMVLQQESEGGADRGVVGTLHSARRLPDYPERRGERRRLLHVLRQQFRGQRNFGDQINGVCAAERSRATGDTDGRSGEIRLSGNQSSSTQIYLKINKGPVGLSA